MGKAARIKRERGTFDPEPKRPTGTYRTSKERQADRRAARAEEKRRG